MNRSFINSIRNFEFNDGIIKFNLEEEVIIDGNNQRILVKPVCMNYRNFKSLLIIFRSNIKNWNQNTPVEDIQEESISRPVKGIKISVQE